VEGASGGAVSSGAPPLAHAVWMTTSAGSGPPPEAVLSAFGLSGSPVALPGGQATAWRAGAGVLKPSDVPPSVIAWQARLLAGVDGRPDFRVSVPLQAVDCSWTVEGWTAWRYEPGSHVSHRWHDIIAVGERLHTHSRLSLNQRSYGSGPTPGRSRTRWHGVIYLPRTSVPPGTCRRSSLRAGPCPRGPD